LDRRVIPRDEILRNTLIKEFGIPAADADVCQKVLRQNIAELGLSQELKGTPYLQLDRLNSTGLAGLKRPAPVPGGEETDEVASSDVDETPPSTPVSELASPPPKPRKVFLAHGKNRKPLEQLKAILTQFKVPFEVAAEEPHKGRPIGAKVAQMMNDCTSGIFIFTADEETTDSVGNKLLRPSDNVVFELGAGTILYGDKIVIFREDGVSFGSDFTAYGHITFEKDHLDAKALDLMKELIGLGFLEVRPT
jgi:Predicted nucleotide-binding protein containing TIR-like domain